MHNTLVTTHTIVLCHGFLGFDNIGPIEYFRGVKEELESRKCKVIVPIVPKTGSIEERAIKLDEQIESLLNIPHGTKPAVHLIGHSMGGIDARRLVHLPNLKYRVLSITTISSPHYGCPIADWIDILGIVTRFAAKSVLKLLLSGSGQAADDMRPAKMAQFNEEFKDVEGIKYFSTTSKFKPYINHPLYLTHNYIESNYSAQYPNAYGPNDGGIAVKSAKWGEYLGDAPVHASHTDVPVDTSHLGIVGWGILFPLTGDTNYDAKNVLFPWLVDNIARKVEGKV